MKIRKNWDITVPNQSQMIEQQIQSRGINHPRTLKAMREVDRRFFVPVELEKNAYEDRPLSIGCGQTISQPYIVALTTSQLEHIPINSKILEIGSGSGYQTAILVAMGFKVFAIERHKQLFDKSSITLEKLGFFPSELIHGDAWEGMVQESPFSAIISAAASEKPSLHWFSQLGENGVIVGPFGKQNNQLLQRIEKSSFGIEKNNICAVRFVPLIRGEN